MMIYSKIKHLLVLQTILLFSLQGYCQTEMSDTYYGKLTSFSNTWGLLKYYHPELKKGKISFEEWNKSFIDKYEAFIDNQSNEEFNAIILELINIPGIITPDKTKSDTALLENKIFNWLEADQYLSEKNKQYLKDIIVYGQDIKHKKFRDEINRDFKRPKESYDSYSNKQQSLMGTVFYLQALKYHAPYEELMNMSNIELHHKYLPLAEKCRDKEDYESVLHMIAAEINDSHAKTWPYYKRKLYLNLSIVNDTVFVRRNMTNIEKIMKGDILLSINNKPVNYLIDSLCQYVSGNTVEKRKFRVLGLFLLSFYPEENVKLKFLGTDNKQYEVAANIKNNNDFDPSGNKEIMKKLATESFYETDGIGYINWGFVPKGKMCKVFKTLKNTNGLIIDLRYYNASLRFENMTKYISNKSGDYIDMYCNSKRTPGIFLKTFLSNRAERLHPIGLTKTNRFYRKFYKNKPIVVIINSGTISYSEMVALAIKYCRPDAVFVGRQSSGVFLNSARIHMPGYPYISFSSIKCRSFDGSDIQVKGIIPDIYVNFTTKDIIERKDPFLQKAIQVIKDKN